MTTRQSALFALVLGSLGLLALSGCSAGNPNMGAAESAMEQQDYERALANVDTAITQDSANVEAYLMKARILRQMADSTTPPDRYKELYKRARQAEEKAVKFDPGQRSTLQNQRRLAYIQELRKGGDAFNRARKTRSKEGFMRAAAYFGAAGALEPDSTQPRLNEAYARIQAAQLDENMSMKQVIPILEEYIRKDEAPEKDAYTILAQLYLQNEDPDKAIEITEKAIDDLSARPTHFLISGTQGIEYAGTYEVNGSSRNVEGTVRDRIQLSGDEGTVSGSFYKKEGGKRQAKGRLQVVLSVQGSEMASDQTVSLGDTLNVSQDLSGVTPLAQLRNLRLNAFNRAGKTDQAMQAYRQQIERDPENPTYRYNYGSMLLEADRFDEAIEQLQKAVELEPSNAKAQYNLGAAYTNKGKNVQDSLRIIQDSIRSISDAAMEANRSPTEEEKQIVNELDRKSKVLAQKKLNIFKQAIPPLQRARQLSGPDSRYRQNACSALLQAYVQTEQMKKAQEVEGCARGSLQDSGQGGNGGGGG